MGLQGIIHISHIVIFMVVCVHLWLKMSGFHKRKCNFTTSS